MPRPGHVNPHQSLIYITSPCSILGSGRWRLATWVMGWEAKIGDTLVRRETIHPQATLVVIVVAVDYHLSYCR